MELLCGHIRIEALAGNGGFGDVYRGYDERMERNVAIKIVNSVDSNEREVLRRLDHKGLPRLYDIVNQDGKTMIIMEWIEGINLERYIEDNGAMTEEMAIRIGVELLDILKYLHDLKPAVIYQDMKPSNVMLMPNGHVKLIDFGTAFFMDYGDEIMRLAGTVGYGAPEQRGLSRIRHASVQSDIYSWGALMYSLLSGRMLNKPPYTMERIRVVCPQVSFSTARVLGKATRRNENERYRNTSEVIDDLKSVSFMDYLYKYLIGALAILFVLPFIIAWYRGYVAGVFSFDINMMDETILSQIGLIVATTGWMMLGLRLVQKRKFLRINRSVYLSERRYSGLWVGTMLAGVIVGYGIWGEQNTINSYAEGSVLPLSVCDSEGNHMLVKYGSEYSLEGELRLCIDSDVLEDIDSPEVTVILTDRESGLEKRRTLMLK